MRMATAAGVVAGATIASQVVKGSCAVNTAGAPYMVSFVGLRRSGRLMQAPLLQVAPKVSTVTSTTGRAALSVCAASVTAPKFTTVKPLGDRVLVKMQEKEEKTMGGILIPTSAQTKPQGGEVVEVGEGKEIGEKKVEPSVAKGDQIVYSKYAGTELEFNGTNFLLLKEDDIVGLLAGEDIKDLKPLNDRVLIKVSEAQSKTPGGVLLTDSAKEKPVIGEIVAAGPGIYDKDGNRKPLEVKEGNAVLYSKYAGNDFKSKDGSQFVVLKVQDVLAVLN